MSLTLYRKYRPQTFKELVGQNHIKVTLQNEIEEEKLAHAYLFSGPRAIGKTTTARLLAKAINCFKRKKGESEPCNNCQACQEIREGKSLDVIEIDAASHTGVDNVRQNIINDARFTPSRLKFKVFIIDEVHMLSTSAFNALLKILEEPPAHTIFILATTEPHKVPGTIISRCQRFDFKKINLPDLKKRLRNLAKLEAVKVDDKVLEVIAQRSEGCMRDAEVLLGQIFSLGEKNITLDQAELIIPKSHFNLILELVKNLIKKDTSASLRLVNSLMEEGVDLVQFTDDLIEFLRKMLLYKINKNLDEFSLELDEALERTTHELVDGIPLKNLIFIINLFQEARSELRYTHIAQLPLELATLEAILQDSAKVALGSSHQEENLNKKEGIKSEDLKSKILKKVTNLTSKKHDPKEGKKGPSPKVDLARVKARWSDLLKHSQKYNHSLFFLLKVGAPLEVMENILKIGFRYKFHEERLMEKKNRETLERILQEIFGQTLMVKGVVSQDVEPYKVAEEKEGEEESQDSSEGVIKNVLKIFGGRVVE